MFLHCNYSTSYISSFSIVVLYSDIYQFNLVMKTIKAITNVYQNLGFFQFVFYKSLILKSEDADFLIFSISIENRGTFFFPKFV